MMSSGVYVLPSLSALALRASTEVLKQNCLPMPRFTGISTRHSSILQSFMHWQISVLLFSRAEGALRAGRKPSRSAKPDFFEGALNETFCHC